MSLDNIKIELNREVESFAPDEEIVGLVYVTPLRECRCRRLTISMNWIIHGSSKNHQKTIETKRLYKGPWEPKKEYSYPFALPFSDGPYTYYGAGFQIDWLISVKAELADGTVETTNKRLELQPTDRVETYHPGYLDEVPRDFEDSDTESKEMLGMTPRNFKKLQAISGTVGSVVLALMLIGAVVYGFGYANLENLFKSMPRMIGIFTGLGILTILFLYILSVTKSVMRDLMDGVIIRKPSIDASPTIANPGDRIEATYSIPAQLGEATKLDVKLVGFEKIEDMQQDIIEHDRWGLHSEKEELEPEAGKYQYGLNAYQYNVSFELPEDAAYSLYTPVHSIEWQIQGNYEKDSDVQRRTKKPIAVVPEKATLPDEVTES